MPTPLAPARHITADKALVFISAYKLTSSVLTANPSFLFGDLLCGQPSAFVLEVFKGFLEAFYMLTHEGTSGIGVSCFDSYSDQLVEMDSLFGRTRDLGGQGLNVSYQIVDRRQHTGSHRIMSCGGNQVVKPDILLREVIQVWR